MGDVPVLVGAVVGFVGALVGAGGGFLLMPVLLLAYGLPPAKAAAISLVTVTAAALSGTLAHASRGHVDFGGGLALAGFAIPGALAGAAMGARAGHRAFTLAFGLLLGALGLVMALGTAPRTSPPPAAAGRGRWRYAHGGGGDRIGMNTLAPVSAGMVLIGGLASLFGIGGGPLIVPLLTFAGGVEVHVAAATAQFVILLSSLAGLAAYLSTGGVDWRLAAGLAAGALLAAPLGAAASERLPAARLLQLLGFCLLAAAARLVLG